MAQDRGDVITIPELLDVVKRAYSRAEVEIAGSELPRLNSATLTVTATLDRTDAYEAELVVVSGETSKNVKSSQKLSIKLQRPPAARREAFAAEDPALYKELLNAIVAASIAAKAAHRSGIADLALGSVTTTVGFDVQREEKFGLKLALKILSTGFNLGANVSHGTLAAHEIELVFEG